MTEAFNSWFTSIISVLVPLPFDPHSLQPTALFSFLAVPLSSCLPVDFSSPIPHFAHLSVAWPQPVSALCTPPIPCLSLVHQAHLLLALCSRPCIYLHSNRSLISSSWGACVEMVIMEWAWRERSPGPLLGASRPTWMALIFFFFCEYVCV